MRDIGSVQTTADLPSTGQRENDCCYVKDTRHHWMWDGSIWQDLGTQQDLTNAPNDRLGLKWKAEE